MWKVSWFYEKVHDLANFGGYAAILICVFNIKNYKGQWYIYM